MKHLRKFNEELNPEEQDSLERTFLKTKISPQVNKVNIKSIYTVLFIQVDGYVENVDGKGKYMMIIFNRWGENVFISVHETLDHAVDVLTFDNGDDMSRQMPLHEYADSWEVFKVQHSDRLVSVLEYNDVNFQEIENILLDYNINVENMWGLIR